MSSMDENASEGGQNGPSAAEVGKVVTLAEAAGYLRRFCESEASRQAPNVQLLARLRSDEGRMELADEILSSLVPECVGEDLLHAWLNGGVSPFDPINFKKAHVEEFGPAKALLRASDRVANREKGVKKANEKLAKAQSDLERAKTAAEEAEAELKAVEAYERSIIYWNLAQHFGKTVAPLFAMGPAWTLMRSVSAHASDEVLEVNCGFAYGKERDEAEAEFLKSRVDETEAILSTLDFFSGDGAFEEALRGAIVAVCREAGKRRGELEKEGRRDRSKAKRNAEAHPKARADSEDVIEGLRRAG